MRDVVAAVLILAGVGLSLAAAIGVVRFPDLYARMHAATKPATLGMVLLLAGAGVRLGHPGDLAKLALVGLLVLLTAPVGAHLIGRAAHRTGVATASDTVLDDLAHPPAGVHDPAAPPDRPLSPGGGDAAGPGR